MGIGFVILIHLIILFMMSLICSLIAGVIAYFTSNKEEEEKIVLAAITPFVGLYTFYICGIIGASIMTDEEESRYRNWRCMVCSFRK
jgi:biotin transporter BioY